MGRVWIAGCGLLLYLLLSVQSAAAQDDHDDMMNGWKEGDHDRAMDGMMRGWDKEDHDRSMSDMMRDWDKNDLERTMSDMMRDWDKEDHADTMSDMMRSWFEDDDDDSDAKDSMKQPIQSSAGVTYEQLNDAVKDVLKGVDQSRFTVQQLLQSLQQKLGQDVAADFNFVRQAVIQQLKQGAQVSAYIAPKGSVAQLDFVAKADGELEDDDHDDDSKEEEQKAGKQEGKNAEQDDDDDEDDGDAKHDDGKEHKQDKEQEDDDKHDDEERKQSDKDEQGEDNDEDEKEHAEGDDDNEEDEKERAEGDDDKEEEKEQKPGSRVSAVVQFTVVGRKAGRDSAEQLDATTTGVQTTQAKQTPASEAKVDDSMQPWMSRMHQDDDDDGMMPARWRHDHRSPPPSCFAISAVVLLVVGLAVFWVVRRTRCLAGWSCCKKPGKQDGTPPKAADSAEVAPLLAKAQAVQLASEHTDLEMANGVDTKQALLKADYTPLRS